MQTRLWISVYAATQNDLSVIISVKPSWPSAGPVQGYTSPNASWGWLGEARWCRRLPDPRHWGELCPPVSTGRGRAAKRYPRYQPARSRPQSLADGTEQTARIRSSARSCSLEWRWRPRTVCQDTDCCMGPWGHTSNVHMHWQMFMLVILI